jgi:hypothetical protein
MTASRREVSRYTTNINLVGRQKVYLKTFDPNELIHQSGDHLTFKLTFRVTDPDTDITLTDPNAKVTL